MSTPRPFHYCRVCYRNFTDYEWKKHRFNPKHKQRLEDKLAEVEVALEHLLSATDEVTLQDLEFDVGSFECYFCEGYSPLKNTTEEGDNNSTPDITTVWTHLAGKKHKVAVQHYFAEYAPPPLYQPHRYWLKKALLKDKLGQLARVHRARDHGGGLPLTLAARGSEAAHESEGAARSTGRGGVSPALPGTLPLSPSTVLGTVTAREYSAPTREPRTLWSKDGIAQNPSGWHQGTRVWGGGIVKVRGADWQPWDIDRDELTSDLSAQGTTAAVDSEGSVLGEARTHRTLARTDSKLAAIHVDPELAKKGNIHTGARPPWETDDEPPSAAQVGPTRSLLAVARQTQRIQLKNPNRVGAEHANRVRREQQGGTSEQTGDADPHWLPKFGRVFNAGSRADSRKEFDREQRKRKLDQR